VASLFETPLPRLLVGLHRDAFSGLLTLRRGTLVKRFEWRGGAPVGVSSRLPAERLCEILAATGALEREARARAEQAVGARGCTELQALASLGLVAPRALLLALAEQLRRSLAECISWRDGEFRLEPQQAVSAAPDLPFDLLTLVYEAVATTWQPHEVLVALGSHALSFATLVPGFRAPWLGQSDPRQHLLPRLDGSSATFALLGELGDARSAAAFWILDALGALVHRASAAAALHPPAEHPPAIEIVVRRDPSAWGGAGQPAASARAPAEVARDAAAEALRREVLGLHQQLRSRTLWEVLGVGRHADASEVRRAYLRAAKRLHPDRLVQIGLADLKTAANEVFAEIARAHEVLSDPERRRHYEENLVDESAADAERIAEAEAAFRRGDVLLRAGNFRGALELLERAVTLWPEEGEYQAALAWALHRKTPPESTRAWEHFQRAFALGFEQAQWLLRASLVGRELGHDVRAAELAARARSLDPNVRA
jgi:tetratricopeptide (TPR) repeat protein